MFITAIGKNYDDYSNDDNRVHDDRCFLGPNLEHTVEAAARDCLTDLREGSATPHL